MANPNTNCQNELVTGRTGRRRFLAGLGATGLASAVTVFGTRTAASLSVWTNLPSIYSMGDVPEHIQAVRIPRRIGVRTRCGVYGYSGDWRNVLFHIDCSNEEPIQSFASVRNRLSERSE